MADSPPEGPHPYDPSLPDTLKFINPNPDGNGNVFEIQAYKDGEWHVYPDGKSVWVAGTGTNVYETLQQYNQAGIAASPAPAAPAPVAAAPAPAPAAPAPTPPPSATPPGTFVKVGSETLQSQSLSPTPPGTFVKVGDETLQSQPPSATPPGTFVKVGDETLQSQAPSATPAGTFVKVGDETLQSQPPSATPPGTFVKVGDETLQSSSVPQIEHQVAQPSSGAPTAEGQGANYYGPGGTVAGGATSGAPVYIVKHGDTMSGIAQENNMSLQQLLSYNPHIAQNPNLIFPQEPVYLGPSNDGLGGGESTSSEGSPPNTSKFSQLSGLSPTTDATDHQTAQSNSGLGSVVADVTDPAEHIIEEAGKIDLPDIGKPHTL